jgi:hypothetical protein
LLAACTEEAVSEAPAPAVTVAEYRSDAADPSNPLPDDRLLGGGHIAMRAGYGERFVPADAWTAELAGVLDAYRAHLEELDGWSVYASLLVPFSGPLDPAGVPSELFELAAIEGGAGAIAVEARYHDAARFVEVRPGAPLAPSTRHVLLVRKGLRDASGRAVERSPELAPIDPLALAALGRSEDDVVLGVTFTTGAPTRPLLEAAARLADVVPPHAFAADAGAKPWPHGVFDKAAFLDHFAGDAALEKELAKGLGEAGRVAVGTWSSRDFRGADELFDAAIVGGAKEPGTMKVEVVLVEPDASKHPPPWPVTIVQHGFNGSNKDVLVRAEIFNREGIAAVGIDALKHGNRGSVFELFDPADARKFRDNFRQTVLDQLQLCRLMASGGVDVDGAAGPDLDGSCHYFGQSMGGILGGIHAAVSADTRVSVLNVPGGGISRILESEVMSPQIAILFAPPLGFEPVDDARYAQALPLLQWATQTIVDAADPIAYAPLLRTEPPARADRHVLIQAGVGDAYVPNDTTRALATAAGIPTRSAAVTDAGGLDALWWVDPKDFGIEPDIAQGTDAHNIIGIVPGVRAQAGRYQASAAQELLDPASVK